MLLAGLVLFLGTADAKEGRLAAGRARSALFDTADAYWYALRWNDAASAASAWTDPAARIAVTRMVTDPRVKITDYSVLQVEIGPKLAEDRAPVDREGVALVRVEAYANAGTKLVTDTLTQHWVHISGVGWVVDGAQSPLGEDRPWIGR